MIVSLFFVFMLLWYEVIPHMPVPSISPVSWAIYILRILSGKVPLPCSGRFHGQLFHLLKAVHLPVSRKALFHKDDYHYPYIVSNDYWVFLLDLFILFIT